MNNETLKNSYKILYGVRRNILTKCYNKNAPTYKNFGGAGIVVCDEWKESFESFEKWALDNGYKKGLSIALINNAKVYSPENCIISDSKGNKKTHGMSKTRPYGIRRAMISRCHREKDVGYSLYGAKGISVCNEWRESFENFWEWASNNGYSDELTIDRINPKGNYEPSNCRWVTQHEQILNQERNKDRTADDRFLKFLDDGRVQVIITEKRKPLFSRICENKKEALFERDYFLKNGKAREHIKSFLHKKKKSLIPQNRIGHKILMILLDKKISIDCLAGKLNVSRQAVWQYIYTHREPRKAVPRIAECLGVSENLLVA